MNIRKIIRDILKESVIVENNVPIYAAVVIEDSSEEQKVRELAQKYVPQGWSEPAHYHMTVAQGGFPESLKLRGDLNKEVNLTINMIGVSEKAIAFGTMGYYSKNEMPHITIGFNKELGGVPADSKEIKNWKPINKIVVTGVIREIGEGNKIFKETTSVYNGSADGVATTTSRDVHAGIPAEFPNPRDYDDFANRIDDISN